MDRQDNGRIFAAETVGTAVLMLGGPGTAILAGEAVGSTVGVALGFGLSLLIMAYVIGPISGCHINPAVTAGMFLARKINGGHAVFALLGQVVGGIGGAAIVYGIASGRKGWVRGQFDSNLWTADHGTRYFGLGAAMVVEIVFTALLVLVMLFATTRRFRRGMGGVVAGLTLTLIHLATIPVDNTSVNPVRSLGTALFADQDTGALQQLWVFIVFPLLGAVVGVIVYLMLDEARLEDTLLAEVPGLEELRDRIEIGGGEIVESVEETLQVHDDARPSTEFPTGNAPD